MRPGWSILCDFDGTATTEDIGDQVALELGDPAVYSRAEADYLAGVHPFHELIRRIFATVQGGPAKVASFARERAVLRPGFAELAAACRDAAAPFVVCSAGLDAYIEPVLERLEPSVRRHIEVHANRARFHERGLDVEFAHFDRGCSDCGACKRVEVLALRERGFKVAVVGDGGNDQCAAEVADLVFARRRLAERCVAHGIPHRRFESFHDVIAAFPL